MRRGGLRALPKLVECVRLVTPYVGWWSLVFDRLVVEDVARTGGLWHQNLDIRFGIVPNVIKGKR